MKKISLFFFVTLAFISCGPSKEEIAAMEKAKMDSVAKATTDKIAEEKAAQDSIAEFAAGQEFLKQHLIDLKVELEAQQAALDDIKQFKLLRTPEEKQQQIEEQSRVVEELKQQIADAEKEIVN